MNGRLRIALCAATATFLTALCLWPLVIPSGWLFQALALLLVVCGVGTLLRRISAPRTLVPLVQLLTVVLLLTAMFASSQALLGCLPGPAAWTEFSDLLNSGFNSMNQYAAPAPALPGLRLILVGAVVLIGLVVDALAATYQRVALTGLPLLALYSVGTGLHDKGPLWIWFLLSSLGYLALLMVEGRDRLARWGRVFHGTPATLAGVSGGNPLRAIGYRIGAIGVVVGLLLPLGLPSFGSGLVGHLGGSGDGLGNSIITSVNPLASLAQTLDQSSNRTVLTYTTNSTSVAYQYLRIVDLNEFNGVAWTTGTQKVEPLPNQLPAPQGLTPAVQQADMRTDITTQAGYNQQWLPMPYPATDVTVNGDWDYEAEGRTLIGADSGTNAGGRSYTVTSLILNPTAAQLQDAPAPPAAFLKTYTALPAHMPASVKADALQVTQGATSAYAKAVALQDWFTTGGGFSYNTQISGDTGTNAIAEFLVNKQGFCVQFAATMAAMARTLGIPARVVIGFTPGSQQSDGSWVVGTKNAHAWPELYFSGIGWLRFEPTPGIGVAPGYSLNSASSTAAPTPGASAGSTAGAAPKPTGAPACPRIEQRQGGCTPAKAQAAASAAQSSQLSDPLLPAIVAAALVLLVLLLLVPMVWRLRLRRRRMRPRSPELSEQQVLDAWRELLDSAWDLGITPDEAETPRRTVARINELGGLDTDRRAAAGRLALATEQVLYAPFPAASATLREDVLSVRSGLRESVGRGARARAVLLPASRRRLHEQLRAAVGRAYRKVVGTPLETAARRTRSAAGRFRRRGDGTAGQ